MTSCHDRHGQSCQCCSAACYAQTLLSPLSSLSSLTCGFRRTLLSFISGFAVEAGAGEGNRTLVISLEGCCSTIELHPPKFECLPRLTHSSSGSVVIRRALRTLNGGGGWIRTNVGVANGFTVRPL